MMTTVADLNLRPIGLAYAQELIRFLKHALLDGLGDAAGEVRRMRPHVTQLAVVAPLPAADFQDRPGRDTAAETIEASVRLHVERRLADGETVGGGGGWRLGAIDGVRPYFRVARLLLEHETVGRVVLRIARYTPGPQGNYGAVLLRETGTAEFVEHFYAQWRRQVGIAPGLPVSRGGFMLGPDDSVTPTPTEEGMFENAGMRWVPPREREL